MAFSRPRYLPSINFRKVLDEAEKSASQKQKRKP